MLVEVSAITVTQDATLSCIGEGKKGRLVSLECAQQFDIKSFSGCAAAGRIVNRSELNTQGGSIMASPRNHQPSRLPCLTLARLPLAYLALITTITFGARVYPYGAVDDLDATFGNSGLVTTDFSGDLDKANSIAIQSDGKIVVAGRSLHPDGTPRLALARYNGDGSLDSSFGNGGRVLTSARGLDAAYALALLPNGKILVAAGARVREDDFGMARYESDGRLDDSFGNGGIVVTDLCGAERTSDIAVQPDGQILLAGNASRCHYESPSARVIGGGSIFAVVRYSKKGQLDRSFGTGGKATVGFSTSGFDQLSAIALQPDGRIVLAGRANSGRSDSPFALARLNNDGSLDTTFGKGGKLTTNFLGNRNQANDLVIQPDGKIIAAGWATRVAPAYSLEIMAIARYNGNGSLDTTFGSAGLVTNDFGCRGGEARAVALQRDGKLVVAGLAGFLRASRPRVDIAVVRYKGDGALDGSFGNRGESITVLQSGADVADAIALQKDGKIVVAGSTSDGTIGGVHSDFALARYESENPLYDPDSEPARPTEARIYEEFHEAHFMKEIARAAFMAKEYLKQYPEGRYAEYMAKWLREALKER
jgi:uncharacterized delta-60 repeat protein